MNGGFFLDTNIFVYSFDTRSPAKAERALQLISQAVATGRGIVSYQVVQEFFYLALRRFSRPLTAPEAEQYLATVFRPLLAIHSSPALFGEALRITGNYSLSWYDSLIVAAAKTSGCRVLYSEDMQHGQQFGDMQIENPFL